MGDRKNPDRSLAGRVNRLRTKVQQFRDKAAHWNARGDEEQAKLDRVLDEARKMVGGEG